MQYDGILLKGIIYNNEPVYLWEYIPISTAGGQEDIRVYYKQNGELGSGVDFYVLEYLTATESFERWNKDDFYVQVIYHGYCYFDGLRHFYMNEKEEEYEGYLNYVDLSMHIKVYEAIQSLIEKFCRDWRR